MTGMKYVLVIDDSPLIRVMVRRALGQAGVPTTNITECGNGEEALRRCAKGDIAVAVLDLNMPVLDGEGFLRRLRAEHPQLDPLVIVVSTEANQRRILSLRGLGIRGFLRKPFEPERLRELLSEHLGAVDWMESAVQPESPLAALDPARLDACIANALETMAFLTGEPSVAAVAEGALRRSIELHADSWRGVLTVATSEFLAREAASSMTGMDLEAVSETELGQVLDELANIIGGELIVLLGGDESPIRLGLPGPEAEMPRARPELTRGLAVDGDVFQVEIGWSPSAAPGAAKTSEIAAAGGDF